MCGINAAVGENAKYDREYQDNLSNYRRSLEDTNHKKRGNVRIT
jgi:hypothetical protein